MPTGYTAGVMDGSIKTFEEFAKQCMRAFVWHMRDESWDADYRPVKPSEHKKKAVELLLKELAALKTKDEMKLWGAEVKRIKSSIKDYVKLQRESNANNMRLEAMLQRARAFVPPTEQHAQIKAFMIQQLEVSLEQSDYYQRCIEEYNVLLQKGMPQNYKKTLLAEKKQDLKRAMDTYAKEVAQCEANNEWCDEFLKAIKEVE